jgi:hypothetical protein
MPGLLGSRTDIPTRCDWSDIVRLRALVPIEDTDVTLAHLRGTSLGSRLAKASNSNEPYRSLVDGSHWWGSCSGIEQLRFMALLIPLDQCSASVPSDHCDECGLLCDGIKV